MARKVYLWSHGEDGLLMVRGFTYGEEGLN